MFTVIFSFQAEAYVNTTSTDLILSNGAVSKSILQAGGQTLQDACSQYVSKNGQVQPGDVVVTGPGNIPDCECIIHTAGSNYDSSNTSNSEKVRQLHIQILYPLQPYFKFQVLEETVQNCLEACDERHVTSVAFPALGAGALGYPANVVAKVMINTVQNYLQTNTTSIRAVKFVIFMDSTFKEFQSLLSQDPDPANKLKNVAMSLPYNIDSSTSVYQPAPPSLTSLPSSEPLSQVFKTNNITIEVVCGDITDDDSDAIVNTTQSNLNLESGTVSKAISIKAGPAMQQSCSVYIQQHKQLEEGKVCVTEATGQLKCKQVFHIVAPGSKKASALGDVVTVCLKEAEHNKLKSLAIPAIGTGGLSYKPTTAAQGICEAIIKFGATQPVFLQRIRIVIFLKDMYQVFVQKFNEMSIGQTGHSQPNLLYRAVSHAVSYFTGGGSDTKSNSDKFTENPKVFNTSYTPPSLPGISPSISFSSFQDSKVQIRVFAKDDEGVRTAEDQLLEIIDQHCDALPVEDPRIGNLRADQISQLTQKAKEHNVSIEVDTELFRVQLKGGKREVQIVKAAIEKTLHELDTEKLNVTAAGWMQKQIKWQYQDDQEQYADYSPQINYHIEEAYQLYLTKNHGPVFTFQDEGVAYEIIFNKNPMKEKDCTTNLLTDVQRIDIEEKINDMLKKGMHSSYVCIV